ncbi:MAG: DegT/DnrJ/eryc1/StrS aminotransferase [uncultured bacterium]|nr:MAG: DegT/DnrJ/eryc1/StrS aminotransferase [uncultured bacterium]
MSIFKQTIFTGFSPNLTARDTRVALSYLLFPWKWVKINSGKNIDIAERALKKYFNVEFAYTFDSGRSALLYALKALGVSEGDEVLVQGYTCMVVVNSIVQAGGVPVFVDVESDLNMHVSDLEKKISEKSKVLIIQHTFGLSAGVEKMLAVAKENKLLVVEDCAHSFGASLNGKKLGTFADIGMLSFGADKVVSSVRGGALITNDKDLGEKIQKIQTQLPKPKFVRTLQHIMHLPVFYFGKKIYHIYLGKILLFVCQKAGIINKVIYDQEKRGESVSFYPSRFANSLAEILIGQIKEVDEINNHRKEIADFYIKNVKNEKLKLIWDGQKAGADCIYLRYPIMIENPEQLFSFAKIKGVILGNWYDSVVAPADVDFEKTKYVMGSCPNAERIAVRSVNLPTDRNITLKNAQYIVEVVNGF